LTTTQIVEIKKIKISRSEIKLKEYLNRAENKNDFYYSVAQKGEEMNLL